MRTRILIVMLCVGICRVWAYYGSGDAVYGGVAAPAYAGSSAVSSVEYGACYSSSVTATGTFERASYRPFSHVGATHPYFFGDRYTPFAGSGNGRPGTTIHTRDVSDGGGMGGSDTDDPNKSQSSPVGDALPFLILAALLYGSIKFVNLKKTTVKP